MSVFLFFDFISKFGLIYVIFVLLMLLFLKVRGLI